MYNWSCTLNLEHTKNHQQKTSKLPENDNFELINNLLCAFKNLTA